MMKTTKQEVISIWSKFLGINLKIKVSLLLLQLLIEQNIGYFLEKLVVLNCVIHYKFVDFTIKFGVTEWISMHELVFFCNTV